jgi:hypothetical protein
LDHTLGPIQKYGCRFALRPMASRGEGVELQIVKIGQSAARGCRGETERLVGEFHAPFPRQKQLKVLLPDGRWVVLWTNPIISRYFSPSRKLCMTELAQIRLGQRVFCPPRV